MIKTHWDPALLTGALRLWAQERHADLQRREFENSLQVGPMKPLGCWGIPPGAPLQAAYPALRAYWRALVTERGFWHKHIGVEASQTPTGVWIYLWNRPALADLLNGRLGTLEAAGEPWAEVGRSHRAAMSEGVPPRRNWALFGFVQATCDAKAPPLTPLYDLIADAYGDKLNPGRTDVFPGVPRERLFQVYLDVNGYPDPAGIHFILAGIEVPGWSKDGPMDPIQALFGGPQV